MPIQLVYFNALLQKSPRTIGTNSKYRARVWNWLGPTIALHLTFPPFWSEPFKQKWSGIPLVLPSNAIGSYFSIQIFIIGKFLFMIRIVAVDDEIIRFNFWDIFKFCLTCRGLSRACAASIRASFPNIHCTELALGSLLSLVLVWQLNVAFLSV